MNATTRRKQPAEAESVPQSPQSTPGAVGHGFTDHSFTLQAIMELQKSVGEMNANLVALKGSVDGMKGKVDDLINWKHKILGGAAVLGVLVSGAVFAIVKLSDYVTIKPPATAQAPVPTTQPVQIPPPNKGP